MRANNQTCGAAQAVGIVLASAWATFVAYIALRVMAGDGGWLGKLMLALFAGWTLSWAGDLITTAVRGQKR